MRTTRFVVMGIFLAVVTGCSRGNTLRGTVTVRGNPLKNGFVSLVPIEGNEASTAGAPVRDGVFVIANLRPGKYRVKVAGGGWNKPVPTSQTDMMKMSEKDLRIEGQIPANAKGNNRDIDVTSGVQEVEIALEF